MNLIKLEHISKYRQELMGIGILGVMIEHTIRIGSLPSNLFVSLLSFLSGSVYTIGFLLLSGLGQFMSLKKNTCHDYVKKRFWRLIVPYWIISVPFFCFTDLFCDNSFACFLGHLTTISYWTSGNYSGMWYIAITVFLYIINYPINTWLYCNKKNINTTTLRFVLLIVLLIFIRWVLYSFYPQYYQKISIGFDKIPSFFVGTYIMNCICNRKDIKLLHVVALFLCCLSCFVIAHYVPFFDAYFLMTKVFLSIIIICFLFYILEKSKIVYYIRYVFRWFGKYSLELYIVHLLMFFLLSDYFSTGCSDRILIIVSVSSAIILAPIYNRIVDKVHCFVNSIK